MKSAPHGTPTSDVEVTNVSVHGFWILLDQQERFLPFDQFPWFGEASIRDLTRVERPSPHHLYWPALDVDLAVESVEHPEAYPLVSKVRPDPRSRLTTRKRERAGSSRSKDGRARRPARS